MFDLMIQIKRDLMMVCRENKKKEGKESKGGNGYEMHATNLMGS